MCRDEMKWNLFSRFLQASILRFCVCIRQQIYLELHANEIFFFAKMYYEVELRAIFFLIYNILFLFSSWTASTFIGYKASRDRLASGIVFAIKSRRMLIWILSLVYTLIALGVQCENDDVYCLQHQQRAVH